jgi:putative hemolysin
MPQQATPDRILNLDAAFQAPLPKALFQLVQSPLEHALAFPQLNRLYRDVSRADAHRPFADRLLERLDVSYQLQGAALDRKAIASGPLVVVANHPFGGIETAVLASLLGALRPDVKFIANYLLGAIPEIRDLLITVNPFQQGKALRENVRPLREAIEWVKGGGLLVVFPAGEVSHFHPSKGAITDPAWSPSIARLIRRTGAPVLPVFFDGANGAGFQLAGLLHPMLRTALLPKEVLSKQHKTIAVRAGELIPAARLEALGDDGDLIDYLRLRTYLLDLRGKEARRRKTPLRLPLSKKKQAQEPIAPARSPEAMAEEIARLPPERFAVESGDLCVVHAEAGEIPLVLHEIGRLREATFRAVGEGTGRALDLDSFDADYTHLFVWNRKKQEVVGAYRIGRADLLVRKRGLSGLYTSTLFRYQRGFLRELDSALELGRSFVRPEYQKSYLPLLLLWKGIARFIVDHPHYKRLFGPVSITDEYQALSKQLMVAYLKTDKYERAMAALVRPRKPHRAWPLLGWDVAAMVEVLQHDVDNVSEIVSCIEADGKGIPVLLKQYLKLGGRILGFNVDPAFGNTLDGLILVDLTQTEPRILERYLGKAEARAFLARHQEQAAQPRPAA